MMLERLLPSRIDNAYIGAKPGLWLLGFLVVLKTVMGLNCILNGPSVLTTADGVPLASYPDAAAGTIVALFAMWAVGQLVLALLGGLALVRYRSMTALVFVLLLAEHLGRKLVLQFLPIRRSAAAPASPINLAILALIAVGLVLSLWKRDERGLALGQ